MKLFHSLLIFSVFATLGCGSSQSNLSTTTGGPRVNTLRVLHPEPDALFRSHSAESVQVVYATGYDKDGNKVFGPDEEVFDEELIFPGFPPETTEVELHYNRAQGYKLASHRQSIDFVRDDDGVVTLDQVAPRALGANRDTFTVRIVNNSEYPDDQVFVSVNGKNRTKTAFHYIKFGPNDNNTSVPFGVVAQSADYSQQLSLLNKEGEHAYSFQCPIENLVSGRIYVSFGKKIQGLGLNNANDPLSLQLPSSTGAPDAQTLYEFMELSATIPDDPNAPQVFTLFANTSVVDFFSVGLGMTLSYHENQQNKSESVGFVPNARALILAEFDKPGVPSEFKNFIRKDGSNTVIRVLSPVQAIALQPNGALSQFLNSAIDSAWIHYASQALNIPDNLPTHTFGFRYTGIPIVGDILSMTCVAAPGGDTQSLGEVCNLPKPTSRIVFFCDDNQSPPLAAPDKDTYRNAGTDGHKRLVSLIGAAFNRGVMENYPDWGDASKFYTRSDGRYNHYSKIMHLFALAGKVYGFGYDDVYGQDPTLARTMSEVNQVVIEIPAFSKI